MSVSLSLPTVRPASWRPACLRLTAMAALIVALAACGKKEAVVPAEITGPATATQPAAPPAQAVSAQVASLSAEDLRKKATQAYQESRLYSPPGDNAMEYYLALRDKAPGDPGVSSALTDLLPMTVIATEQSRDRDDFVEAKRLYALIEKADKNHPALPRLKATIAGAEESAGKRAEALKLTAEQEQTRKAELEKERLAQQQQQQQQAAQLLAEQAEQAATVQRDADAKAAVQREADQKAAAQRDAAQKAAAQREAAAAATAAKPPAAPTASDLRAVSTPAPSYPVEALRAGQSGEVQVEFTVAADGSVTSARVVRSNPPRIFDREAVSAVRRWRFEPIGAPVTTRRTIGFNPGG